MSGNWTPGPWMVVVDESAAQCPGFPVIEAQDYTIVGVEGMFGELETDFANAHLIAAAPELYAVLEACRNHFILAGWAEDSLLIESIDKALRKARGEAE